MNSPYQALRILSYVALLVTAWKVFEQYQKLSGKKFSPQIPPKSQDLKVKNAWIDSLQKTYGNPKKEKEPQKISTRKDTSFAPPKKANDTLQLTNTIKTALAYPKNNLAVLQSFFSALQSLENGANEHFRIFYFADSQIEGDRITASLRTALQEKVGGCGVGLQGFTNTNNIKFTIQQENDSKLTNYFLLGKPLPENTQTYGILGQTYLYSEKDTFAYTIFRKSDKASEKAQKVENLKILFRNPKKEVQIEVLEQESLIFQKKFATSSKLQFASVSLEKEFSEVKINWHSVQSPEMYAVALDCHRGITVDNVPIRGSAGLEFTKMDFQLLQAQAEYLKPCLVILHFGVNVTMNTTDFSFYERKMLAQINFLKKAMPKASFVLVGISDRAYKTASGYETYPALEILRNTQKNIAFQTGCAFWDLYEAMGGKNTMPLWVEKGLASKDFTHFTLKGAELIGNMFFEALWSDYQSYKTLQ
ncbi:MAG: hypothetical protein RMJ97_06000 [Raineya sp.]|nr:hypothetical protein [Raineya sp.]MDW8296425.1 hypothetical protein [Raineya sp.]